MADKTHSAVSRLAVILAGASAGLAGWLLSEAAEAYPDHTRLLLFAASFGSAFFSVILICLGPLKPGRALLAGLVVGTPASLLMVWASFRFDAVNPFLETVHPVMALALVTFVPIPYLVAGLGAGGRWLNYHDLFDQAWQAVVRTGAALIFTGLVWLMIWLSDLLFSIVGLDLISELLDIDPVPWLLTGIALGLALAIAHELAHVVSPHLPIRLLRVLALPVLVVTAVFLVFLPVRGLSGLFGDLSAGLTLMLMAFASATLVSAVLDRDDGAMSTGILRWAAMGLALLLPVMAGLSGLAVLERVGQYGWTPDRIAAITAAAVLTGYGVLYAAAILRGRGWARRIRRANAVMALVAVAIAGLWLTPVIDPQRISARDQVARFEAGEMPASGLDLWAIGKEWGREGVDAIDRLAALDHPEAEDLRARIELLNETGNRGEFQRGAPNDAYFAQVAELEARLVTVPADKAFPEGALDGQPPSMVANWVEGCDRLTPGGHPGCAALLADFIPEREGLEIIIFALISENYVQVTPIFPGDFAEGAGASPYHPLSGDLSTFAKVETYDRIMNGDFEIVPKRLNVLEIDGAQMVLLP